MKLDEEKSTSPRYMIDITGTDPLSLGQLGGRDNSEKLEKRGIFNLRTGDRISMNFDNQKDIVCQSFCLNPDWIW